MPTEREEIQAALALAKWQGEMTAQMATNDRRFKRIDEALERVDTAVGELRVELATVKTKIAFYSAIGGIVAGGIATFIVAIGSKAFS